MHTTTKETGDAAEELAQKYLIKLGYQILDTNWYFHHLELDIVAQDGDQLVIVEVKSCTGFRYEHPSEAVTNIKINRLIHAAEAYIYIHHLKIETRFDIITVIFYKDKFELEHFKDAFYPTL
ncbi:MAG: YraN family protein [Mariniphaga sp.]|nr:YraN family protein [Mariniphaga sp.]MDD4227152.1 YraN family protein [Mariniphaga sp.]MDD4425969.1 YraN family protein [Mariniphaga sp.]